MLGERFWSKVIKKANGCWAWKAYCDSQGYGRFFYNGKPQGAHRLAYIDTRGHVPDGLTLDHLCRNRACVNPAHLEIVPRGENVLRGVGASARNMDKTTCPRGHMYDGMKKNGNRFCRTCTREQQRLHHEKHKLTRNERRRKAYKAKQALAVAEGKGA